MPVISAACFVTGVIHPARITAVGTWREAGEIMSKLCQHAGVMPQCNKAFLSCHSCCAASDLLFATHPINAMYNLVHWMWEMVL